MYYTPSEDRSRDRSMTVKVKICLPSLIANYRRVCRSSEADKRH